MRKLTMLATVLAMVLATAVPAFAQTLVDNSDTQVDLQANDNNVALQDASGGDGGDASANGGVAIGGDGGDGGTNEAEVGDVLYESDLFFGYYWYPFWF